MQQFAANIAQSQTSGDVQVQWFYMIRGDPSRHGLADEQLILDMALRREMGPEDLVWNRESGTEWVRAGSVPGLLPAAATPPVVPATTAAAATLEPVAVAQSEASQPARLPRWIWAAVAAGVLLVTLALVLMRRS